MQILGLLVISQFLNGQLEAQSRPFRAEQAELSYGCGKELVAPFRSGESPSFTKEFFNHSRYIEKQFTLFHYVKI